MKLGNFFIALCLVAAMAIPAIAGDLVITIDGVKNDKGKLMIAISNNQKAFDTFNAEALFATLMLPAKVGTQKISLSDFPAGDLAVSVLHDENVNLDMDLDGKGMPKEGFGLSNNGGGKEIPMFADAKVTHTADGATNVNIRMNYLK